MPYNISRNELFLKYNDYSMTKKEVRLLQVEMKLFSLKVIRLFNNKNATFQYDFELKTVFVYNNT